METLLDIGLETTQLKKVSEIKIPDVFNRRMKTGIDQLDSLFNGGILPGSTFTLTAAAGTGKTSLMLQVLESLALKGYKVGYCSGEESIYQLAYTCKRLNVSNVEIANIVDVDTICMLAETYDILIVDSFQSLKTEKTLNIRQKEIYSVQTLVQKAKETECAMGFIMHLTKDGKLKGSTVVPHTVDTCVNITISDDLGDSVRTISLVKNRFGPCNELNTTLTGTGYDFTTVVESEESPSNSKANRKQREVESIMQVANDDKWHSIAEFISITGDVARIQFLLREQTTMGTLEKTGRGRTAKWKKA